jgi:hypothetical protein
MIRKILIVVLLTLVILGCKKSIEAEPETNPLVGTWLLAYITDDIDNPVSGSEGIDGVIVRMDLSADGTGNAYVLNGTQELIYSCNWSTGNDQFVINVQGRGEITHEYEIISAGKQAQDEAPPGTSLVLLGSNQFANYLEINLILYYIKK